MALVAVLAVLTPVWYRAAVAATDEWAAAVRALVNLGRKPLADALGLTLPGTLVEERRMWALVTKLTRLPYHERAAALGPYRVHDPGATPAPSAGPDTPAPGPPATTG